MIDWNLLAKVAGGGFGVTILVLIILSLVPSIVWLVVRKMTKVTSAGEKSRQSEGK